MSRIADKTWIGLLAGLVAPLVFLIIIYLREKYLVTLLITSFLRIGLILNLAMFLLFFNLKFDKIPKGILFATILYGLVIVYFFLWG